MAYWGSGTAADPYICDSFSSLVEVCGTYVSTIVYVEMATKDQQGNPIPVEDRVMDFRKSDWYIGNNDTSSGDGYNAGWTALTISGPKVIDGKDWVILGISLRNCHLFYFKSSDAEGTRTLKNFIIKNAYLQGHSSLVANKAYGARLVNLSNIKASGVLDMSTVSSPSTDSDNLGLFTLRCQTTDYNPYFRITKCSFNFKFITLFKSSCFRSNSNLGRFEYNNCLFNIEGKVTAGLTASEPAISDMVAYNTMFFGKFFFCKFSGSIYYDHGSSNVHIYLYKNYAGTLDVIDFDIYPLVSVEHRNYSCYIVAASTINTNKIIQYCKTIYLHGELNSMAYKHPTNTAPFLHPTDRTEMCDEQWLTEKGFIIGSPPVD